VSPAAALVAACVLAAPVRVGLDVVDAEAGRPLVGKRVGLVANGASVTLDGRHAVEVLRSRGVNVVRLFAPEHGFRGHRAAGESVASGRDAPSGLPVVSLYGARRRPLREDVADLDALVVDLQDAGVRFYTYESTLLLCLAAAAEFGLELVVLDRPNPLGGERMAGPLAAAERRESFVSMAPGPLIHGLTLGELARLANAHRAPATRLTVVAMRGWHREMSWADTGRAWVPASPNLRSAEAVLAYPGLALLEASNVSEGRGTLTPFLLFGAPWLEMASLTLPRVPGFSLEATGFTPRAALLDPSPKYRDVLCSGARVRVTDAHLADPWRLGLALVTSLARRRGFEWLRHGAALDALLGTTSLREALERGDDTEDLAGADAAARAAFAVVRRPALLY
jgi:uncharacterized protein YbbC (DUF1343 family)